MILPSGGVLQWLKNIGYIVKGIFSILLGIATSLMGMLLLLGALFVAYWEKIYDLLLEFPGWLEKVISQTIQYVEKIAQYLQEIAGFFDGPFAPVARFLNAFLPVTETVRLLIFIGAFAFTAFIVRLLFKFTVIFR